MIEELLKTLIDTRLAFYFGKMESLILKKAEESKAIFQDGEIFLTKEDAGILISLSVSTIEGYIAAGDLKKYYLRGKASIRLKKSEVLALVKEKKVGKIAALKPKRVKRGKELVK